MIGDSQTIAALTAQVDVAIAKINLLVLVLPNELALLSQHYKWVAPTITSCFFVVKFFHIGDDDVLRVIESTARTIDKMAVKAKWKGRRCR